ncbi:olfactory receptor 8B3-like [Hyperolius riggenbachi]|uniref:olfactory receptor 8B3-like n=1 Tax=Hyperolius riggenbachi TaxID=752182 RepID=UPI0035A31EB2
MNEKNKTVVTFFILKGFSDFPELQFPMSLLILLMYLTTLGGNMAILLLVWLDSHLHTPMYFFLCNLSVLDICSTTVTLHKNIVSFVTGNNEVSFIGCMAQVYFFAWFFCNDFMLLTSMGYDSDTFILEIVIFIDGGLFALFIPFLLTSISYVFIIATIMKIKSSTGRRKAFYTCSSHLTSVLILYASMISQYLSPSGTFKSRKLISLFNTAVVPMLNPFIYSLRNKDVKSAIQKKLKNFMAIV